MSSGDLRCGVILLSLAALLLPPGISAQQVIDLPGNDRPIQVALEDGYTVGSAAGEDWETFGRISAVAFDGEGNLYILDRDNFRIVKVGPGGDFLAEMGRAGGGPGEFGQPLTFAVTREGEVRVYDLGHQGFTVFNPDGSFNRTVPLGTGDFFIPNGGLLTLPDGSLVDGGPSATSFQVIGGNDGPPARLPIHHFALTDVAEMTTAYQAWNPLMALGDRREEHVSAGGFQISAPPQRAFDPELFVGVLQDGILAIADTTTYTIKLVEPAGRVNRVLHRPFVPREVTRRDRQAEQDRQLEAAEARKSSGGGGRSWSSSTDGGGGHSIAVSGGQISELLRARIEGMEFGEFIPILAGMATDWEGRIWVERTGDRVGEDGPIDLITGDGRYLGSADQRDFRIPAAFGPGGLVAYVETDELDVPRVEVKRLTVR